MTSLLLDGGMGTALLEAGLEPGALPERWLLARPDAIAAVHRGHVEGGASVVLTCTFNLAGPRLSEEAMGATIEELAARAVEIARAAAPGARVAGAVGPAWLAGPDRAEWADRHGRALRALAAAGVDLLWTESHWDLDEARVALAEARRTGKPVAVTFGLRNDRGTLRAGSGERALDCLGAVAADGAAAIGANCTLPGDPVAPLVTAAASRFSVPVIAKPSAGLPGAIEAPEAFGARVAELVRAGARWVGGCCGASAAHLAAVRARLPAQPRG